MAFYRRKKMFLSDGREVNRITYVRYQDAGSGKYLPDVEISEDPDLDKIEDQMVSTLTDISSDTELAAKSTGSVKMLLGLVDKKKREAKESEQED